jgi:hypothetical protein
VKRQARHTLSGRNPFQFAGVSSTTMLRISRGLKFQMMSLTGKNLAKHFLILILSL